MQGLQVLNWGCAYEVSSSTFQIFLPIFQNLQELNIPNSKAGDSCLHVLGQFCKQLKYVSTILAMQYSLSVLIRSLFPRYLNVEKCTAVTDAGIKGLCLSIDNQGIKDERVGQCKSIHTLNIRHTKVSEWNSNCL